ncbi:NAD-dependent epimerase/dehydratase family protein [Myxococcota bacterium]|nr:NAD-dependent epimerase/dehydratase family protein [Myxococcota bacterium]
MRTAITGASGLVGGNLAAALRQAGHEVVATRRPSSKVGHLDDLDLRWVDADLSSTEALARAFDGAEVVFHCAAAVSVRRVPPPWMVDANVTGTQRVIDACRQAGVRRLVHCSSTVAVGVSETAAPIDETAPWNLPAHGLDDAYAVTKHDSELLVHAAVRQGLDAVIVNPGYMFGPRDVRPSSGRLILEVVHGRFPGMTTGSNCFVDVRDVATSMVAAAERGRRGERYILGGQNLTYVEVFGRIAQVAGVRPPRFALPRWLSMAAGLLGDVQERLSDAEPFLNRSTVAWGYEPGFRFDSAKARAELGHQARPVEEGLRAALDWFSAHGMR